VSSEPASVLHPTARLSRAYHRQTPHTIFPENALSLSNFFALKCGLWIVSLVFEKVCLLTKVSLKVKCSESILEKGRLRKNLKTQLRDNSVAQGAFLVLLE
jgi:hypothetical protein